MPGSRAGTNRRSIVAGRFRAAHDDRRVGEAVGRDLDVFDSQARLPDFPGMPLQAVSDAGLIVDVNEAFCRLLRRPRSELVGHSPVELTHPADQETTRGHIEAMTSGPHRDVEFEKRYVRGDGSTVWARVTAAWVPTQRRAIAHVVDLTDLVGARDNAHAARARLAALVKYSANLILVFDGRGRLVDANPATERLIGDRIGQDGRAFLSQHVHPADIGGLLRATAEVFAVAGPHEPMTFRLANRDGNEVYLEAVANNQLADPDIKGVVVNARDVSERVAQIAKTEQNLRSVVEVLGRAGEFRDPYTAGHQHRVADLAVAIASGMGVDEELIDGIRLGALIHDVGKLAIPAETLAYPGPLSPALYELIKTHSQVGHDIIVGIPFPWPIAQIVLQHHERLDGSGYPRGLVGDEILLEAQIVAVADVAEAMTSHRPYRPALGSEAALEELHRGRGTMYNAEAVDACTELIRSGHFLTT